MSDITIDRKQELLLMGRGSFFTDLYPDLTRPVPSIAKLKSEIVNSTGYDEVALHLAMNAIRGAVAHRQGISVVEVASLGLDDAAKLAERTASWSLTLFELIRPDKHMPPDDSWPDEFVAPEAVAFAHADVLAEGAALAEEPSW